jgi:hypothetical protein
MNSIPSGIVVKMTSDLWNNVMPSMGKAIYQYIIINIFYIVQYGCFKQCTVEKCRHTENYKRFNTGRIPLSIC